MTGRYAERTTVDVGRSKNDIERVLRRYGADQFVSGWDCNKAMLQFRMRERIVRFIIDLPELEDFAKTPKGRDREDTTARKEWEQAIRQRWRALYLVIRAKLEAVESDISDFEEEFLANIILPDGTTVGEYLLPQIAKSYETGKFPKLLPGLGD